jgi:hypothetical protein
MLSKHLLLISKIILTIGVLINFLHLLSLRYGFLNSLYWDSQFTYGIGADLFAYYQAGYNVLHNLNPYDFMDAYMVVQYCYPYIYPPLFAFSVGIILNIFQPWTSYIIWICIIELFLFFISYITYKSAAYFEMPKSIGYLTASMWFLFSPVYLDLYLGQTNLIIAVFIFLSILFLESTQMKNATLSWIMSCSAKPIPYMFAPIYAANKRSIIVLWNFLFSVSSNLVFFGIIRIPTSVNPIFQPSSYSIYHGDFSLKGFISALFGLYNYGSTVSILLTFALVVVFVGVCLYVTIISKDIWLSFIMYTATYFLISTRAWELHYNLMIPVIIFFIYRTLMIKRNMNKDLSTYNKRDYVKQYSFIIVLVLYGLLAIPTPINLFNLIFHTNTLDDWTYGFILIYHGSKCIPTLCIFLFAFYLSLENRRAATFKECYKIVKKNVFNLRTEKINGDSTIKFGILL